MEGTEAVDELLLGGSALPELDRRALAQHCAAVAHHMSSIARLFDPTCSKAAPDGRKSKKGGAGALAARVARHRLGNCREIECGRAPLAGDDDEKAVKPKRELTAYNLFIQVRSTTSRARAACRGADPLRETNPQSKLAQVLRAAMRVKSAPTLILMLESGLWPMMMAL